MDGVCVSGREADTVGLFGLTGASADDRKLNCGVLFELPGCAMVGSPCTGEG